LPRQGQGVGWPWAGRFTFQRVLAPPRNSKHSKIFAKADIGALKGIDYEHD